MTILWYVIKMYRIMKIEDFKKKNKQSRIQLCRYGGLNMTKQKHYTSNEEDAYFHSAPEKFGFYAFLYPYVDLFFVTQTTGKIKKNTDGIKRKREAFNVPYKKFSVEGYVWTHMVIPHKHMHYVEKEFGSWSKIHTEGLRKVIDKDYAYHSGRVTNFDGFTSKNMWGEESFIPGCVRSSNKSPYNRGFSTDHLEIFVGKDAKIF